MYFPNSPNPDITQNAPFHESSWWSSTYGPDNLPYCITYHTVQYFFPPDRIGQQDMPYRAPTSLGLADHSSSQEIVKEMEQCPQNSDETKPLKTEKQYNDLEANHVSRQPSNSPINLPSKSPQFSEIAPPKKKVKESPEPQPESSEYQVEDDHEGQNRQEIKRALWRPPYNRRQAFLLFKGVVSGPVPAQTFEQLTKEHEERLMVQVKRELVEMNGEVNQRILAAQLVFARKNMTSHFAKLIRFSIKLYKEKFGKSQKVEKLEKALGLSVKIATIVNLYRQPDFGFFVEWVRQQIFLRPKMPALIGSLNIRPCEKLVMLAIAPGFVYALEHPWEEYTSWNMETHTLIGDTSHIVKEIIENNICYEEIMERLMSLYSQILANHPDVKNSSKYNNLSYHYRVKMEKIMRTMASNPLYRSDWPELLALCDSSTRSYSLQGIKELLSVPSFQKYMMENYISNKQLIIDILEDSSLSCHSKKIILENYPRFSKGVQNPNKLTSWHV